MKLFTLFLILFLIPPSLAYQIKYYSVQGSINISEINPIYLTGVKVINIMGYSNPRFAGIYHIGGIIDCYEGCPLDILKHELAHSCQWLKHDSLYNLTYHKGKFAQCLNSINNTNV